MKKRILLILSVIALSFMVNACGTADGSSSSSSGTSFFPSIDL